ncbi:hypothetical protein EOPP23_13820 [Endozoicomonas sp. OPT23]|nr:hypothetical protein [Endozoicomonas sp. OPT23]
MRLKCYLYLLVLFVISASYFPEAQAEQHQILVQNFPHRINLERWNGRYDIYWQSDPMCIFSADTEHQPIKAHSRLQGSYSGQYAYALRLADYNDELIPIEIALGQGSNHQKLVYENPEHNIKILNPQTDCTTRDFHFQIKISDYILARLPFGHYQNHFDFFLENDRGEQLHKHFHIRLFIPRLIKIGVTGDIKINEKQAQYTVGTTHACVYTNDGGEYRIRADSANYWHGNYHLCAGKKGNDCWSANLPYKISYDAYQRAPFDFIHPRHSSHRLPGSDSYFDQCSRFNANAEIKAIVNHSSLIKIPSGDYSDTITLIVETE